MIRLLVALACIAAGATVGALNPQPLSVDLGFSSFPTTLGVTILVALLTGAIIGGLMLAFSVVLPLRRQLKRKAVMSQAGAVRPMPPVEGD